MAISMAKARELYEKQGCFYVDKDTEYFWAVFHAGYSLKGNASRDCWYVIEWEK